MQGCTDLQSRMKCVSQWDCATLYASKLHQENLNKQRLTTPSLSMAFEITGMARTAQAMSSKTNGLALITTVQP